MSWTDEDRLLFLCCRTEQDEETTGKITSILDRELNWNYISEGAARHGISPLLYRSLKDQKHVPGEIMEILGKMYYTNSARNIRLLSMLGKVLETFNDAGIPVALLKGAALLETVYPDIALRPLTDVDFLVHREDLPRVREQLDKLGYRSHEPGRETTLEAFGSELAFVKEGHALLEFHWDIAQYERLKEAVRIDTRDIWKTARTCRIAGADTLVMSPEYLILDICLHLSMVHFFCRLMWLCDLREMIRYYEKEIDWQYVVKKAVESGVKTALYYSLSFSRRLLGADVPAGVIEELRPSAFRQRLMRFFVSEDCRLKGNRYIGQILLIDKSGDILKVLLRVLFPSGEWLRYRYSVCARGSIFPYRIIHPFMLFFSRRFQE